MELFLCVLGMVLVVEGLPYFTFPEKMKALENIMHQQDDTTLRVIGGGLLVLGLVILVLTRGVLGSA